MYKKDGEFVRYFPDISMKRVPEREYFWKVLYVVKHDDCVTYLDREMAKLTLKKKNKSDRLLMT